MDPATGSLSSPPPADIPPLGLTFTMGTWLGGMLYGVNACMFFGALYVLYYVRPERNWMLIICSLILFSISTVSNIVSFVQIFLSLHDPQSFQFPGSWDLTWIAYGRFSAALEISYVLVKFTQDILLMWRLYIVFNKNWRVLILPITIEAAHIATSLVPGSFLAHHVDFLGHKFRLWSSIAWGFDVGFNSTLTLAIAGRLWYLGRNSIATLGKFTYRSTIYVIIESGGVFASATLACFIMDLSGSLGGVGGVPCLAQLASITPLIIIVRIGLGITHGSNQTDGSLARTTEIVNPPRQIQVQVSQFAVRTPESTYEMSTLESKGCSLPFAQDGDFNQAVDKTT